MKLITCDSNLQDMCKGCSRVEAVFNRCAIYEIIPHIFSVIKRCPFNYKEKVKKVFKRVGQQKQRGGTIA